VQRLAIIDTVTEQYNRRKFFELGAFEMNRFRRYYTPLSAIMLDMDNFKQVNDTYGHAAGDQVLRAVAQRCRATIRVVDILGRYGGDEFAILLPGAELREAREIAERLRLASPQRAGRNGARHDRGLDQPGCRPGRAGDGQPGGAAGARRRCALPG
jgi:diguanylate cyclase (GGDEF)-like protein